MRLPSVCLETGAAPAPVPVVRPLEAADLPEVAAIHVAAFTGSALSRLGLEAVRRYYEWQMIGPHNAVALGAWDGGRLDGFCFAGVFRGALGPFVRRNRAFLASRVLLRPWLAFNPIFLERLPAALRALRPAFLRNALPTPNPEQSPRAGAQHPTPNTQHPTPEPLNARTPERPNAESPTPSESFSILAIAVHPRSQQRGIGRLLLQHAEQAARERGFPEMLLTVHASNRQAIAFYERLGWEKLVEEGEWRGKMGFPLP